MLADIIHHLPFMSDTGSRALTPNHTTQAIIHSHLIIKIIETSLHIVAVLVRIIYLTDYNNVRILRFQYLRSIRPECSRHHLCHIAAETIYTLACPIKQDIRHLAPCIWHRLIMIASASRITIIHSIVEFHGLIPVVAARTVVKAVVTRCLSRTLLILFIYLGILGMKSLELRLRVANIVQI